MLIIKNLLLFQEALKSVYAYKLRTILALLSIALGISGVTLVVGSVYGAFDKVYEMLEQFGSDAAIIFGGVQKMRAAGFRGQTLTLEDAKAIKNAFPTAYVVVPMNFKGGVKTSYKGNYIQTRLEGATEGYADAWSWPIFEGMDFTKEDVAAASKKCLLGSYTKEKLFDEMDPIGKYITVGNFNCQVTGILVERGVSSQGHNVNDKILMPLTSLSKYILKEYKYVRIIRVRFEDIKNLSSRIEELKSFLRRQHNLGPEIDDDFVIISPKEILKFFFTIVGSLVIFLIVITIMMVTVGGFVMANLFLLSVQDRTKEIGIRRSVGATRSDIFLQYMYEFGIITVMGGCLGFLLGVIFSRFLSNFELFAVTISFNVFIASIFVSILIAIVFGIMPARNASRVDPIKAIRT